MKVSFIETEKCVSNNWKKIVTEIIEKGKKSAVTLYRKVLGHFQLMRKIRQDF